MRVCGTLRRRRDGARKMRGMLWARPDYRIVAACSECRPDRQGPRSRRSAALRRGGGDIGTPCEPASLLVVSYDCPSWPRFVPTLNVARPVITALPRRRRSYGWIIGDRLASELDVLARDRRGSVIRVGLNPGFIFNALLLTASGIGRDCQLGDPAAH